MQAPTVSMFLPTYARMQGGHLQRAVHSALAQSYKDFELLVVDDASVDGSEDFLRDVAANDARVRIIRLQKNTGLPAYALAQAYPEARGRLFAWLFDDCELAVDHLETLVATLDADPDAAMAYAKARAQLSQGSAFEIGAPLDIDALERGANMIPNVCVVVRREVIESVGWYDHHVLLKRLCDWDLWLRIAREHKIVFVDRILATEHGVGLLSSLGRIFHAAPDLVVRYAALDRRERLAPTALRLEEASEPPPGLDLDDAERIELEFILFEHALLLGEATSIVRAADRLSRTDAMPALLHRFEMQNEHAPDATDLALLAAAELLRRRVGHAAVAQIDAEIQVRAALKAADDRSDMIAAVQQQNGTLAQTLAELQQHSQELALGAATTQQANEEFTRNDAKMQQRLDQLEALADQRLHDFEQLRVQSEAAARLHELAQQELSRTTQALFVYRDAADQRYSMLAAANTRIDALTARLETSTQDADVALTGAEAGVDHADGVGVLAARG